MCACSLVFNSLQSLVCSPPDSFVHGISQARILEWVAISFSRGSSHPRDRTCVSHTGRHVLYHWTTCKALSMLVAKANWPHLRPFSYWLSSSQEALFIIIPLFPEFSIYHSLVIFINSQPISNIFHLKKSSSWPRIFLQLLYHLCYPEFLSFWKNKHPSLWAYGIYMKDMICFKSESTTHFNIQKISFRRKSRSFS